MPRPHGKGRIPGTPGVNGAMVRLQNKRVAQTRQDLSHKRDIDRLLQLLEDSVNGKVELNGKQIKACEVILDRFVPRLSSVEQKEVNELDTLTREQILERIAALLAADATLLPELIALDARKKAAVIPNAAVIRKTAA